VRVKINSEKDGKEGHGLKIQQALETTKKPLPGLTSFRSHMPKWANWQSADPAQAR
jgi:hypothetical protein